MSVGGSVTTPLPELYWTHVEKTDTCWLWTSSITRDGYGRSGTGKTHGTTMPHRAMWISVNGPIAADMEIDHVCSVRNCVNPDHLDVVTHAENIRRAVERRTHCPNGHSREYQVSDYAGGSRCLLCRRKTNRESVKRWRQANREKVNAYAREYRARQKANAAEAERTHLPSEASA